MLVVKQQAASEVCIHKLELTTVSGRTRQACCCVSSSQLPFHFIFFPCPLFWTVAIALLNTLRFHKMWRASSGAASEGALTLLLFFIHLPILIDFPFYLPVFSSLLLFIYFLFHYFYRNLLLFFVVCSASCETRCGVWNRPQHSAVANTGLKVWAVTSGQRMSLHRNSRCLHERFSLKR